MFVAAISESIAAALQSIAPVLQSIAAVLQSIAAVLQSIAAALQSIGSGVCSRLAAALQSIGSGSAVDCSGSAVDRSGSAVDCSGSAVDRSGVAVDCKGLRIGRRGLRISRRGLRIGRGGLRVRRGSFVFVAEVFVFVAEVFVFVAEVFVFVAEASESTTAPWCRPRKARTAAPRVSSSESLSTRVPPSASELTREALPAGCTDDGILARADVESTRSGVRRGWGVRSTASGRLARELALLELAALMTRRIASVLEMAQGPPRAMGGDDCDAASRLRPRRVTRRNELRNATT